eukprot:12862-Ditylum_brightwellii.AAC.1
MATHPDAIIQYFLSGMVLNIHTDTSYLSEPNAHSTAGGHYFLGSVPQQGKPILLNGTVHILCQVIKHVAASAAEAELAGMFMNAQQGLSMCCTLLKMGHPQPPTPMHSDKFTAVGIANKTIKPQRTPGQENLADYPTKHHTGKHHQH